MATASLLPIPRAVFYNATTGDAIAGGFVYTYVPGGITPKQTWQDAAETIANSNPIALDSSGSCLLYGSGTYQITVTDSLGNQIPGYSGLSADASTAAGISSAMLPFVGAATTTAATGLLTFTAVGTTNSRTVLSKLRDVVTAGDFGAVGDNLTDDSDAIQAAVNECSLTGSMLILQGTTGTNFKITKQISITSVNGLSIVGSSASATNLFASGNFSTIFGIAATTTGLDVQNVGFVQNGTTTLCVALVAGASSCKFTSCIFTGDQTGSLISSQAAGFIEYWDCLWNVSSPTTIGIVLDGADLDTVFMGGRAQGAGTWLSIQSPIRGMKATAFTSTCTGAQAIQILAAAFNTQFIGCTIDQAGTNCISIGAGAVSTQIIGGYYALATGSAGIPILVASSAGNGTSISGVQTVGGVSAIAVQATGAARVSGVSITNNTFQTAVTTTVALDSVNGCIVTGNTDLSTPSGGSWATAATFGAGKYTFGSNDWSSVAPVSFDTGSSYHASPDRGITLANKGVAVSASGTTLVVASGITSVAPNVIRITQLTGAGMTSSVDSISGANFTIAYGTSGAATFMWEAEYYS